MQALRKIFSGAINLLCIEDHPAILTVLCDCIFTSPLFTKKPVNSIESAFRALRGSIPYHCWILDLTLHTHNDGLELFKKRPQFPYCVVLSGAQSMDDATEAIRGGCYGTFDKIGVITKNSHKFIYEVCSLATLSFLLKTKRTSRFDMFEVLIRNFIRTPEEWSRLYCLNEYSIRETCIENAELTAKQFLYAFHALRSIALLDCYSAPLDGNNSLFNTFIFHRDFILQCAEYFLSHIESVYGPIYLHPQH